MKKVSIHPDYFHGYISLEIKRGNIKPWRLPHDKLKLFPSPDEILIKAAGKTAGVRLRFKTDSKQITLKLDKWDYERSFDLVCQGCLVKSISLAPRENELTFFDLPKSKTIEIWLPLSQPVVISSFILDTGSSISPVRDRRKRWITYGSSITQCGKAFSPALSWPSITARELDLNLTCLGFHGQCHLESTVAQVIRDQKADFISMKIGININGSSSLSTRTFKPSVIGFVQIIREKHKDTPILLIGPVLCPNRESKENLVGLSLEKMRLDIQDAVKRIKSIGDKNIHYLDGRKLFGKKLAEKHLPDHLHPDAEGNVAMGKNLIPYAKKIFSLG